MKGKVYMVGAGPGAADLLTLRAASVLRGADVVLHDDLISTEILALIPQEIAVVNVGKRCGRHGNSQEQINNLMVEHAGQGRHVVRLKSGDPAVFGRLGEELDALRNAGIPFEIVPGITAASAAAADAGVTLTDRRFASTLVLLTAHNCRKDAIAQSLLDPDHTTYAVYMPGPDYARTAKELMELGLRPSVPCMIVSHAGRASERTAYASLESLHSVTGVAAPALLIIGEVARSSEPSGLSDSVADVEQITAS